VNRLFVILAGSVLAATAFGDQTGFAGTKTGGDYGATTASSGVGFGALVQMVVALVIVAVLLRTVLPKIAGKLTKKLVAPTTSGLVIEESAQFAGGNLYVVSVRGKTMLLSATTQGVQHLADLTATPEPAKQDPFVAILEKAENTPAESEAELEIRATLDALRQLNQVHAL
jgi:hypothetical protein